MSVYGEFLFIENFISGIVILIVTGRIKGCRLHRGRLFAGAAMCGAYAFVIFIYMPWHLALLTKAAFSMAVVLMVYRPANLKTAASTAGVFYLVSFLTGGLTIALMYMFRTRGITSNGSVYLQDVTYVYIAGGVVLSLVAGLWLAEVLKIRAAKAAVVKTAVISIGDRKWQTEALVDTGNSLKEPVTGFPVAVLSRSKGEEIRKEVPEDVIQRMCLIPYKGVGGRGLLYGFRPDSVTVGKKEVKKVILAISEGEFDLWKGSVKYDILLHQQMFEGEDNDGQEYDF